MRMQKLRLQQRRLYDWYEHDVAADDKIEVRPLRPRERDQRVLTPEHAWFELRDSAIGPPGRYVGVFLKRDPPLGVSTAGQTLLHYRGVIVSAEAHDACPWHVPTACDLGAHQGRRWVLIGDPMSLAANVMSNVGPASQRRPPPTARLMCRPMSSTVLGREDQVFVEAARRHLRAGDELVVAEYARGFLDQQDDYCSECMLKDWAGCPREEEEEDEDNSDIATLIQCGVDGCELHVHASCIPRDPAQPDYAFHWRQFAHSDVEWYCWYHGRCSPLDPAAMGGQATLELLAHHVWTNAMLKAMQLEAAHARNARRSTAAGCRDERARQPHRALSGSSTWSRTGPEAERQASAEDFWAPDASSADAAATLTPAAATLCCSRAVHVRRQVEDDDGHDAAESVGRGARADSKRSPWLPTGDKAWISVAIPGQAQLPNLDLGVAGRWSAASLADSALFREMKRVEMRRRAKAVTRGRSLGPSPELNLTLRAMQGSGPLRCIVFFFQLQRSVSRPTSTTTAAAAAAASSAATSASRANAMLDEQDIDRTAGVDGLDRFVNDLAAVPAVPVTHAELLGTPLSDEADGGGASATPMAGAAAATRMPAAMLHAPSCPSLWSSERALLLAAEPRGRLDSPAGE